MQGGNTPKLHATPFSCDICGQHADACGNGGAIVAEPSGCTTLVCQECVRVYCAKKTLPHRLPPGRKWQLRRLARVIGLACDPDALLAKQLLDPRVPFAHSVAYLLGCGVLDRYYELSAETCTFVPATITPSWAHCWVCGKRTERALACTRCRTAMYCSGECQNLHARLHAPCCAYVASRMPQSAREKTVSRKRNCHFS